MLPIAIVLFVFVAGWLIRRPAAGPFRNFLRTLLVGPPGAPAPGGLVGLAGAGIMNAPWYLWQFARIMTWLTAGFAGLLVCATLSGNQWFLLAVLAVGLIPVFVSAFVLHSLRLPAQEIASRLGAAGGALTALPLTIQLPAGLNPAAATSFGKGLVGLLATLVIALANGLWLGIALPILACGGCLRMLGGLATLAERTMRWCSRLLALASMGLLFLTALCLADAAGGPPRMLDVATLGILTLLFMVGATLSILAADQVQERTGVPLSASVLGVLTVAILGGMFYAHLSPRAAREIARAFKNSADAAVTWSRIGNDQAQITTRAYWVTTQGTHLKECWNCVVDRQRGMLDAAASVKELYSIPHATPLMTAVDEAPFEMDGILWMRVYRVVQVNGHAQPALGYNTTQIYIVPKNHLDGAPRPEDAGASPSLTRAGSRAAASLFPLATLVFFPLATLAGVGLAAGGLQRFFRSPSAVTSAASSAASRGQNSDDHDGGINFGRGVKLGIFTIALLFVAMPLIMLVGAWLMGGHSLASGAQFLPWLAAKPVSHLLGWVVLIMAVYTAAFAKGRRINAVFLILIAFGLFAFSSDLGAAVRSRIPAYDSRPATFDRTSAPSSVLPTAANMANYQQYLPLVDAELARYPGLVPDRDKVLALIRHESDWNPRAVPRNTQTGALLSSAQGLMQLIEATRKQYGVTDGFDPAQNVRAGLAFLSDLHAKYGGEWRLMLAGYHSGPENIPAGSDPGTILAKTPAETREFVQDVLARAAGGAAIPPSAPVDRPGVTKANGDWLVTALASRANPLGIALEPGRYTILVRTQEGSCPTWDPMLAPVCADDHMPLAESLSAPEDFPLGSLGIGKPVIETDQGQVGLPTGANALVVTRPMTLKQVVPNDRRHGWSDNRGHWKITVRKEG